MASQDYERYKLKSYRYWDLYLHENQYYLGRVYIWLKRDNINDLMDITNEERAELFEIGRQYRVVMDKYTKWKPDLYNWAALGNLESHNHHVHVHVIPRYKTARIVESICTFTDKNWGKNYAPYDKEFKVSDDIMWSIYESLKRALR